MRRKISKLISKSNHTYVTSAQAAKLFTSRVFSRSLIKPDFDCEWKSSSVIRSQRFGHRAIKKNVSWTFNYIVYTFIGAWQHRTTSLYFRVWETMPSYLCYSIVNLRFCPFCINLLRKKNISASLFIFFVNGFSVTINL